MMMTKTLGILELANEPVKHPGFLAGPGTFSFPVRRLQVPGAMANRVLDGDRSVGQQYVECARELERQGVDAIIANCGFAALYQSQVAAAVKVPVALSSLLLVPFFSQMLAPGSTVGLLCADAMRLNENHFVASGWSTKNTKVAVAGIEGTESLREFMKPSPNIDVALLIREVVKIAKSVVRENPNVGGFVFECSAFPVAAKAVQEETGLPVADYVRLANILIDMSPPRALASSPTPGQEMKVAIDPAGVRVIRKGAVQ